MATVLTTSALIGGKANMADRERNTDRHPIQAEIAIHICPNRNDDLVSGIVADQHLHADACLKFFVDQLRAAGLAETTIDFYQSDIKSFRRDVEKDLLEIEASDVYRVVEAWKEHAKEATIQRRASSLHRFYDLLFIAGLISIRPTANLHVPKPWKCVRTPAAEDLERVVAAPGKVSPFDVRDLAVLLLLRDAGIRANAIARAELANVDWNQGRLMLRGDKYGKDHWVPLSKRSAAALRFYVDSVRPYFLHGRDLPYLFVGSKGRGPLTRQRVWQIADYWTMKVLGVRYSPHSWRHAVLTEGAEKNMDVFDLMNMAGHLDPNTTQEYLQHSTAKLREIFYRSHPRAAGKEKTK
jgi:integrase/recombinase XerD